MGRSLPPGHRHLLLFSIGLALLALALSALLIGGLDKGADFPNWPQVTLEEVVQFVRASGSWGVAASIGLMVLHSFIPFPAEFVAIANGLCYGPFWGSVITWTGAMLGAFLAFGLAKLLGRPFVDKMLSKNKSQQLDAWLLRHGASTLLFCRFIPVIAFNLINYAAGLTRISWWTFAWTTGLGILPLTILMVVMGDRMSSMPWQMWLILIALGLPLWLLSHRLLQRFNKMANDASSTTGILTTADTTERVPHPNVGSNPNKTDITHDL